MDRGHTCQQDLPDRPDSILLAWWVTVMPVLWATRCRGLYGSGLNFSSFNLPTLDESCSGGGSDLDLQVSGNITSGSNGSLLELSDDSLLFIGTRSERFIEDSPSPTFTRSSLNSPTLSSPKLTNFLDRSSGDSANISECESKMGDSPRGVSLLQGRPDLSLSEGEVEVRGVRKGGPEARDVGYSSESQSNDETETMQQQIAMECRYAGIIEVSSDSPLGEKMAIPPPGGVRQDYYCMTHVDLDSTDKTTTTDDGNTTDDRENVARVVMGVKAGQLPGQEREGGGDSERDSVGVSRTEPAGETGLNINTNSTARDSGEDIEVKSWLESSDECDRAEREGAGLVDQRKVSMTEQPLLLVGSESDSATESQEKIRYLIDHAEDLVMTPPRPAAPASPQRKTSPSKQTQTVNTATSSVESSCDASSENSDDSAGEEFSTATDDGDDTLFDSVITLDGTADLTSLEDVSTIMSAPVTVDTARLRKQTGPRGGKKDRPWSVVGFQDDKKMDFNPLSTSESAIDREHPHTDTDSSSSHFVSVSHASTFPRRARSRVYQRAVSACEGSEQTSPRATKRKLKYSSSSSATDSQASRSSATRVAVSTEDDDDDRTLVYDSVERLRSQGRPPCLLETESETTDEYVTASMDEMMTSADEDPHNSTGSFSENAWDNYQMMYPTASEDATEEVLHWEPVDDMEFDDDFTFTVPKTSSVLKDAITTTANKLQLKQIGGGCEDSDSDMEDFHSVLEDSESCLKLVDRSLKKKRSNPMGSGLAAHAKYAEILATCETNIVCMKNVCSHLTQEDIGINDVQRVQDLLDQWEKLHALAADRHQQSQQLSAVSESLATIKSTLTEARRCLTFDLFASREELETTINTLRVKGDQLDKQRQVIGEHRRVIDSFVQHHPAINVAKFLEELTTLDKATTDTQQKVSSHLLDLENNWAVWVEYLEGQQELDALMATDRERLYTLLCQREAGHRVTKRDVLKELETLQSNLCVYEDKLHVLQAMRQRLTRVSDDSTQRAFLASLADLRNQLQVVSQRCRQMYRDVEDQDSATDTDQSQLGRLAVSAATVQESYKANKNMSQLSCYDDLQSVVEEGCVYRAARRGRAWSWLRSVPVQIVALIMVAGLVYVLDPDILSDLASFSLTFTPELRHINGPPPL
ncbi:hypothetical protein V1264_019575 [Littorina saxatilis]|uniref:KASH domain-containing protein n=1 Tax=Littorina saxatilis TaxID=31220 RepID=A0AAN9BGV6_9CAEN